MDVEIRTFDPEGLKRVGVVQRRFEWISQTARPRGYDLHATITLKPGRYSLRFAVHDVERDRVGSVYADVVVPDFERAPLSLSGAVLHARPGPLALEPGAVAALVPIVPTMSRTFAARDRVTAFLRVHQGGGMLRPLHPVTVVARIRDARDIDVHEFSRRLTAREFNALTRGADYTLALPLASLPPGDYLLTIEASLDGSEPRPVQRKVRFTISE